MTNTSALIPLTTARTVLENDLGRFFDMYEREHAVNPELWPLEMSLPDWYEQLIVHLES